MCLVMVLVFKLEYMSLPFQDICVERLGELDHKKIMVCHTIKNDKVVRVCVCMKSCRSVLG